jgi:hypothetical protein
MIIGLCIGGYILAALLFCLWDAAIGFGFEWNGEDTPPLILAAVLWPIGLLIAMVSVFLKLCLNIKDARLARTNRKQRMRIAAEEELQSAMQEIESPNFNHTPVEDIIKDNSFDGRDE